MIVIVIVIVMSVSQPSSYPTPIPYDLSRVPALSGGRLNDRVCLFTLAKAAEKAERWADVCRFMRELIRVVSTSAAHQQVQMELTGDERQLVWLGYKQWLYELRAAFKQHSRLSESDQRFPDLIEDYKLHTERLILSAVTDILTLLENNVIKQTATTESKVYYMKFAGDLYRYIGEVSPIRGYERRSVDYYQSSYKLACQQLPVNHPTRLAVALNYSVCLYDLFRHKKEAAEIAKQAFENAINRLDDLDEHQYKDSTLVMQLIRDNLTLWTQLEQQQQQEHK